MRWTTCVAALVSMTALAGCLVTDSIEFEQAENWPPVILDKPRTSAPIGGVIWIDLDSDQNEWSFDVDVRDENVDEELFARVRIQTQDNRFPDYGPDQVVQRTGRAMRELTITIPKGALRKGECHRLQLAVSGSFITRPGPEYFGATRLADDLALASWMIWEGKGPLQVSQEQALELVESCRTEPGFLDEEAEVAPQE